RLAMETGAPIIPTALIGTRDIQQPGQVIPSKGKVTVIYGEPIEVERCEEGEITHEAIRELTDEMMRRIQKMSGQEYVDTYAQVYKKMLKEQQEKEQQQGE
ncbi:MAG: 1-acyl-sn-glycerol-3-phosphate acyltransferase, partial [Bifidobacteriaceae bacterium]|nr:1-acyl-sn-glycerol-3-phosphate acyltransferase [Bifidobacteriaceae bacterium]